MTTVKEAVAEELFGSNSLEIAYAINEAVNSDNYDQLERLAQAFAEVDDMENAHWVKGLAHQAYLNSWGYDTSRDHVA